MESLQQTWDLPPQQVDVVARYLALFQGSTAKEQDLALQGYAPEAVFEDPLLVARGRRNIAAQFYALRLSLSPVSLHVSSVESRPPAFSPQHQVDVYEMDIVTCQRYHVVKKLVELQVTATLSINAQDNSVLHHSERWHGHGRLPLPLRRVLGGTSCWVMVHLLRW